MPELDIYHNNHTGIFTAQGEELNYFHVWEVKLNRSTQLVTAEIYFWEKAAHCDKPPAASRFIEFTREEASTIEQGEALILTLENYPTTVGDTITLLNGVLQ